MCGLTLRADYEVVRAADHASRSHLSPDLMNFGFEAGGEG